MEDELSQSPGADRDIAAIYFGVPQWPLMRPASRLGLASPPGRKIGRRDDVSPSPHILVKGWA